MLKRNISTGLFSPQKKNNKHILIDAIKQRILSPTKNKRQNRCSSIIRDSPKKIGTLRGYTKRGSVINGSAIRGNTKRGSTIIKLFNYHSSKKNHHNIFTNLYNNKENSSLNNAKIYLKLEKSEEIAKIVNEEEKKRYFNREFHINKNINREELKRRIELTSPSYQRTYNKKSKTLRTINSVEIKRRKNKFLSSSYNNYGIKSIKNLININNKLIHNYKYQGENEILKSKMNYDAVTNFLQSMDEQKKLQYEEMEKKFLENKKKNPFINDDEKINEKEKVKNLENEEKNEEKNKIRINKKLEKKMKLKESDFIKFKKKMLIKEKKTFVKKSKVFDNILHYDFKNYYTSKDEDEKHQSVNYRLLGRTILMRNLMKQMKIAVYKDETLNVLRGFQSLKIASINSDAFKKKNQDSYCNQNNNDVFYFSGSLKDKPIPHFLKLKFNMNTTKKFGEINGSYFGLPV